MSILPFFSFECSDDGGVAVDEDATPFERLSLFSYDARARVPREKLQQALEMMQNVIPALGGGAEDAATFPADARHLHAPRALLEVMVGGQPLVSDGKIFFVQLTPVRLLADPERFAALHRELYGDAYYLPAPPLPPTVDVDDAPGAMPTARRTALATAASALAQTAACCSAPPPSQGEEVGGG